MPKRGPVRTARRSGFRIANAAKTAASAQSTLQIHPGVGVAKSMAATRAKSQIDQAIPLARLYARAHARPRAATAMITKLSIFFLLAAQLPETSSSLRV